MPAFRTAIIGAGFMGRTHIEALRRLGNIEVGAVADATLAKARSLTELFNIPVATTDYREILSDPSIDAIHICTPNALHFSVAQAALLAGKHVICEKPLATSSTDARALAALAAKRGLRHATNHNLRFYPMVQQMRRMCEDGDLGDILIVQGTYSQDWLLYDTDWNWRIDSKQGGPSRTMADIGSHWCDMAEHVTGLAITAVCADLQTFHKTRQRPKGEVETFGNTAANATDRVAVTVDTEDFGAVLLRFGDRARGAFTASQVSAGRKNRLSLEIYGTKSSLAWDQERPNELWHGYRDAPSQLILKDPALMKPAARSFAEYPGGHAEGYPDTFKQLFRRFYAALADRAATPEYPQFTDGLRQLQIVEAELESSRRRAWIDVPRLH